MLAQIPANATVTEPKNVNKIMHALLVNKTEYLIYIPTS